jgi:hypothetical protein
VVQGGGFAGLVKTLAADATELAPADGDALRAKVEEAGLFGLSPSTGGTALPDVQTYEITVEDGGRTTTAVLGERDLAPELRSLIAWLRTVPGHQEKTGY